MQLKLFSDLIDAFAKVLAAVKGVTSIPKAERDRYRQTMDETYRLVDTTINMVIVRLGDILTSDMAPHLVSEVTKLDNYQEWIQAEREFRLCKSLRVALRESEGLTDTMKGHISAKDWDAMLSLMHSVLAAEGEVACFLSERFRGLAEAARQGASPNTLRNDVTAFRDALIGERQRLIQQELELYSVV
jgi:hypothetical protein